LEIKLTQKLAQRKPTSCIYSIIPIINREAQVHQEVFFSRKNAAVISGNRTQP